MWKLHRNRWSELRPPLSKVIAKKLLPKGEFLEGLAALKSGEIERAIGKFDQVIEIDYRPLTTKARYAG